MGVLCGPDGGCWCLGLLGMVPNSGGVGMAYEEEYRGHAIRIVGDESAMGPDEWSNSDAFLVGAHPQFWVAPPDMKKSRDPLRERPLRHSLRVVSLILVSDRVSSSTLLISMG